MFEEKQVRAGAGMLVGGSLLAVLGFAYYNQTFVLLKTISDYDLSLMMLVCLMVGAVEGVLLGLVLMLMKRPLWPIVGAAVVGTIVVFLARRLGVMVAGEWGTAAVAAGNVMVMAAPVVGAVLGWGFSMLRKDVGGSSTPPHPAP